MERLIALHDDISERIERSLTPLIPLLARLLFAATLLGYFWSSAVTKLGAGLFGFLQPSTNAYAQIFPRAFEAVGYNTTQLTVLHWAVVTGGMWAEFLLPLLIAIGLFTRLASLGMIGFVILQSLTDLFEHGGIAQDGTLGAWFDRMPDSLILDQRAFWMFPLVILVITGAGVLSCDRVLDRQLLGRPKAA